VKELARELLSAAGYTDVTEGARVSPGVTLSMRAVAPGGTVRYFELGGVNTPSRPGLSRIEAVWRSIAKASVVAEVSPGADVVVLTVGTVRGGPLAAVTGVGRPIAAIIDMTRDDAADRLSDL
jgi:site-specific DNA-methyltransferase (adenine-specific)